MHHRRLVARVALALLLTTVLVPLSTAALALPEGWERLQTILLSGETPALEKRLDLSPVVTGQLISEVNRFDREKVRQQARAFKP
jgi:hypothetical protein